MKTGITKSYIREYKQMNARQLHPQSWHDFMSTKRAEAVGYAIENAGFGDDIQEKAIEYYENMESIDVMNWNEKKELTTNKG